MSKLSEKVKIHFGIKSPATEQLRAAEFIMSEFWRGFDMVRHANCRSIITTFTPAVKYWDVKAHPVYADEPAERYQMRKWLSQVPHGGVVGDMGVLIVYNEKYPELSEILVQRG